MNLQVCSGASALTGAGAGKWLEMKEQTKHFAECVFEYGMNRLEAQIKKIMAGVGYEF